MTTTNRFKDDNVPSNPTDTPSLADVIDARLSRRGVQQGAAATAAVAGASGCSARPSCRARPRPPPAARP